MSRQSDQFDEIWEEAKRSYEETTGKKLENAGVSQVRTVDDLEGVVASRAHDMTVFREKRAKLFSALRKAMAPVELVGNLTAGAASAVYQPTQMIFGAVTYLIGAAKGVSSAFDSIRDLLEMLHDFTERLREYSRAQMSLELKIKLSKILTTLLEILAIARVTIKRNRILGFGRHLVLGADEHLKDAVAKLDRLTKGEGQLVGAEVHTAVKKQEKTLDGVAVGVSTVADEVRSGQAVNRDLHNEVMNTMRQGFNSVTSAMDAAQGASGAGHADKMKVILKPSVNPQDAYEKISKAHLAGSGEWIRTEPSFRGWFEQEFPFLWISGIPGAGKSFLSASIISYLDELYPQRAQNAAHVSIGFFFFKDDDPDMRSFHQALRDMAFQIRQNDLVYAKYLSSVCDGPDDIKTLESAWRILFTDFFVKRKPDSRIYLVMDGIDEGFDEDLTNFLPLLKDLEGSCSMQVLMVGRPHLTNDISDALETEHPPTVIIDAHKNSTDISNYVKSCIRKSRKLRSISAKAQKQVAETLSTQAEGMFLWVDLMIRELNDKGREPAILAALNQLPRGIPQMLQRVLERFSEVLSEEDINDLNLLLAWVTCAQRPLKLAELEAISCYNSPTGDGILLLEGDLRGKYASFFSVSREDGLTTSDLMNFSHQFTHLEDSGSDDHEEVDADGEPGFDIQSNLQTTDVTFCHASIGDFFRDEGHGKAKAGNKSGVGVEILKAREDALLTVFRVMCDADFAGKSGNVSLMDYALRKWPGHLKDVNPKVASKEFKSKLGPLLVKFCCDKDIVLSWGGLAGVDVWENELHKCVRCWLDDEELFEMLEQDDKDWVKKTSENPVTTFEVYAERVAHMWLETEWWLPDNCFVTVQGYIAVTKGTDILKKSEVKDPSMIEATAEWAGYEKTATWHRKLAIAMRDLEFYEQSALHFQKAIELDPKMGRAHVGLAKVYYQQGEYERAKEALDNCFPILELDEQRSSIVSDAKDVLSKCYEKLGEPEKAFNASRESWEAWAFNQNHALERNVLYLAKLDRSSEIMEIFHTLKNSINENYKISHLVFYMEKIDRTSGLFRAIRQAARDCSQLPELVSVIKETIRYSHRERKSLSEAKLEFYLSEIFYYEKLDPGSAVEIWKDFSATQTSPNTEASLGRIFQESTGELVNHYLRVALALKGKSDVTEYIQHLERLAWSKASKSYNLTRASTALGLWYRLNGDHKRAEECHKPHVKQGINILSDNDPDNDADGYCNLAITLLLAGDELNAVGILRSQLTKKVRLDSDGNRVADDDGQEVFSGNTAFACDGVCWRRTPWPDEEPLWLCRFCIDKGFCNDCFEQLKAGTLPINECSPDHEWLLIAANETPIPEDKLLIGDTSELVDAEAWKQKLKKSWDL